MQTSLYVYCQATDRQGNFAINDTILERVQLTEFNQTEDTIILFNREAGESHNYVNLLWGLKFSTSLGWVYTKVLSLEVLKSYFLISFATTGRFFDPFFEFFDKV